MTTKCQQSYDCKSKILKICKDNIENKVIYVIPKKSYLSSFETVRFFIVLKLQSLFEKSDSTIDTIFYTNEENMRKIFTGANVLSYKSITDKPIHFSSEIIKKKVDGAAIMYKFSKIL